MSAPIKSTLENISQLKAGWSLIEVKNSKIDQELLKNFILLKYPIGTYVSNKETISLLYVEDKKAELQSITINIIKKYNENNEVRIYGTTQNIISSIKNEWDMNGSKKNFAQASSSETDKAEQIFKDALERHTSDIHIEVRRQNALVKFRVHGELSVYRTLLPAEGTNLANIIYQVFTANGGESATTFNPKEPQNGLVDKMFDKQRVRARVATIPANPDGFDMIIRLLPFNEDGSATPLHKLGYSKKEQKDIEIMVSTSVGVIIIAGTTGSGKSTTLKNVLTSKINESEGKIKVITVEDPPEYYLPCTQVPVNRENSKDNGKTEFANAMKASMRSDPDILMVGEIRDDLTAQILTGAVQSGHQVFTTIHASSAFGIIPRLEGFGVTRDVISSPQFISGLIYQKLLQKICPHCSKPIVNGKLPKTYSYERIIEKNYEDFKIDLDTINKLKPAKNEKRNIVSKLLDAKLIDNKTAFLIYKKYEEMNNKEAQEALLERIKKVANIEESNIRFRGDGCEHCKNGVAGRLVCAETIVPDLNLLALIRDKKDPEAFNYWKTILNGKYAMEDAIDKMIEGIVDPVEVEEAFQALGSKII